MSRRLVVDCECTKKDPEISHDRITLFIKYLGRLAALVFLAATALLVAGYSNLSIFIGEGLLGAIYSGLIYFVLYRLASGFFGSLFRTDLAKKLKTVEGVRR